MIKKRSILVFLSLIIFLSCRPQGDLQMAFLSDIHFHDVYAEFEDNQFEGIVNPINGKQATIRTMESQLHSTRLFNENYFVLKEALDDIGKRNISIVVLPGDLTDDGQPVHARGLMNILNEYREKYSFTYFATNGNHDPCKPYGREGGKKDYLGQNGLRQPIFSSDKLYQPKAAISLLSELTPLKTDELPVIISEEVRELGYEGLLNIWSSLGFYPQSQYLYWETPFSDYLDGRGDISYLYETALAQSDLDDRCYFAKLPGKDGERLLSGVKIPDSSYLVEPVDGLWLLSIDSNVYSLTAEGTNAPDNGRDPEFFNKSSNAGYPALLKEKPFIMEWIKDVSQRAEAQGKVLVAFSHFPAVDFYDGAGDEIRELFGDSAIQMKRVPSLSVSQTLAAAGLKIHFAGHMHINDTAKVNSSDGNELTNIQVPSLAAYIPAYKVLTVKSGGELIVDTVELNDVDGFDELFPLYRQELERLKAAGEPCWDESILESKNYREMTENHLNQLVLMRLLPKEWPADLVELLLSHSGSQLLSFAQSNRKSAVLYENDPSEFDWEGKILAFDFYRLRSGDQLALSDEMNKRLMSYQLLAEVIERRYDGLHTLFPEDVEDQLQKLSQLISIILKLAQIDIWNHK